MNNKIPKVTIYMPNYNYGKYLEEAVDSVKNQVFKDWELIVIDDGSTDDSVDVLKKFANEEKITVIHQKNKGLNVTNNVAIRLSRGKYIVRLDADDFIDESFLLVLSSILDEKQDVGLVFSDFHHVDQSGNIIETIRREKIKNSDQLLDMPAHGACTMYRKEILMDLGTYDEEFSCQDGYEMWIKFIEEYKPYNINVPLFYYRQHSASSTKNTVKILDTRRAIEKKFVEARQNLDINVLGLLLVHESSIYKQNRPFVKLNDKYLIDYPLEESNSAHFLTNIAVSSSDEGLKNYIKANFPNVIYVDRNETLRDFNTNNTDIVTDAIKKIEKTTNKKYEAICLLSISTPLLKAKHIDHAVNTMQVFDVDSVRSVSEELAPCYQHEVDGLKGINNSDGNQPRLERNAIYKDNGAVLLIKTNNLEDGGIIGKKVGHITMLPEESIKINSDFEFWLAEQIIANWDNSNH